MTCQWLPDGWQSRVILNAHKLIQTAFQSHWSNRAFERHQWENRHVDLTFWSLDFFILFFPCFKCILKVLEHWNKLSQYSFIKQHQLFGKAFGLSIRHMINNALCLKHVLECGLHLAISFELRDNLPHILSPRSFLNVPALKHASGSGL